MTIRGKSELLLISFAKIQGPHKLLVPYEKDATVKSDSNLDDVIARPGGTVLKRFEPK